MRASLPVSCSRPSGDDVADAAELLGLADGLAEHDTAPPFGAAPSATTTIENLAPRALALGDRRGHRLELERDLRDEDRRGRPTPRRR